MPKRSCLPCLEELSVVDCSIDQSFMPVLVTLVELDAFPSLRNFTIENTRPIGDDDVSRLAHALLASPHIQLEDLSLPNGEFGHGGARQPGASTLITLLEKKMVVGQSRDR